MKLRLILALLLTLEEWGCGTLRNLFVHPEPYGGIEEALNMYPGPCPSALVVYSYLDAPFCLVADTILLPVTIPIALCRFEPAVSAVRVPVQIDSPHFWFEFSRDSRLVRLTQERGRCRLFDLQGREIEGATEPDGRLREPLDREFPLADLSALFPDLTKNSIFWSFSPENELCFRVIAAVTPSDPGSPDFPDGVRTEVGELWKLGARPELLWKVPLQAPARQEDFSGSFLYRFAAFLRRDGELFVVLAGDFDALILSAADGTTRDSFSFSRGSKDFSGDHFALEPKRRLLACVDRGLAIRVVSLDPPHPAILESRRKGRPQDWNGSVHFVADHLVWESHHWRGLDFTSTTIFHAGDWKPVWEVAVRGIKGTTLSPDGRWIAFVRDGFLEIAPFSQ